MIISLIVAMDQNRLIGRENRLPWRLPADLKRFRRLTMGKPVVMGRKTYESIGQPLKGRTSIVLTGNPTYQAPGCIVIHTIEEVVAAAKDQPELMVVGGVSLYTAFLSRADHLYLTLIHATFTGDTYFPAFDWNDWQVVKRTDHQPDTRNLYPYSFITLHRRKKE